MMTNIKIETTVTAGEISITSTTLNKKFILKHDNWNEHGELEFTLNELLNMGEAIKAMQLEMAKISLKELGGNIGDKDWAKV